MASRLNLLPLTKSLLINHMQRRFMPVNVPPTATGKRRFRLEVETDPHKLVNYCCGVNYHKDEPLVKLKPDSEYPDWLWDLRLTPKPNSWEMEKGTKEYYLRLAEEGRERNELLRRRALKPRKIVSQKLLEREAYKKHMRFAALAHLEADIGLDSNSIEVDWYKNLTQNIRASDYYIPMNQNKVIYMDKIVGNRYIKNYHRDDESTFNGPPRNINKRPPIIMKATLDNKQRHRYAGT